MAIANILLYWKSSYDLPSPIYFIAVFGMPNFSFSPITPKVCILEHMFLHNTYINVAIAHILLYRKSLYDLPGPKYKKCEKWVWR